MAQENTLGCSPHHVVYSRTVISNPARIIAFLSLVGIAQQASCTFDSSTSNPALAGADASMTASAPDAAPTLGDPTCAFASGEICAEAEEGGIDSAWDISTDTEFDTDSDPLCRSFAQGAGPEACLVLVESFSLALSVRFRAIGTRPMILATVGAIEVAGTFDVSSGREGEAGAGANHSGCAAASMPENDTGGAGGGAGGSFGGKGGDGGNGDTDSSLGFNGTGSAGSAGSPVGLPLLARGGCPGTRGGNESNLLGAGVGGVGGGGGGAVSFLAGSHFLLESEASLRATGAGGVGGEVQAGGGGGGSGGFVRIEAPQIYQYGNIGASGGGGGEGGHRLISGPKTGNSGADGALLATGAEGGSGAAENAGNGGPGSTMNNSNATTGFAASGGGGGGGGSAGFIVIKGEWTAGGLASPSITHLN